GIRRQYILRAMCRRRFRLLVLLACSTPAAQALGQLRERLAARVAQAPATGVGLYYRSLTRPDSLLLGANLRFHAASTMKVPVMVEIFRDADEGLLRLDDSLAVHAAFPSLVDGSPFEVDKADDSDSTLSRRGGANASERVPPGTRVAHKTGWIGEVVYHDAALVYPPSGSYVLVVLTGGIKEDSVAHNLVADVSRMVWEGVSVPR